MKHESKKRSTRATHVPLPAEPEALDEAAEEEAETDAEETAEEEAEVKQEVSLPATTLMEPLHASLSLLSNKDNITPSLTGMLTSHSALSAL